MDNREEDARPTRRGFLQIALAGVTAAGLGASASGEGTARDPERERLENLAARYGSELGELRRSGGES